METKNTKPSLTENAFVHHKITSEMMDNFWLEKNWMEYRDILFWDFRGEDPLSVLSEQQFREYKESILKEKPYLKNVIEL